MLKHEKEINRIFEIFKNSQCEIRPHFILTGPSGTGKSYSIKQASEMHDVGYMEINAASLTKEGTSGNSLSKALTPLMNMQGKPVICFVDEFDKLFISGNTNSELAHETTNGVQNEFLKVLESDTASVFGDYGKYVNVPIKNVLFIFAGAFNGEEDMNLDKLREFGLKTEFLGRVGLNFSTQKITLDRLLTTMKESQLLQMYLDLFPSVKRHTVEVELSKQIKEAYEKNTLGFRLITTITHQYFILGSKGNKQDKSKVVFNKTMTMG